MIRSFVLLDTDHGSMIVNRFDYNRSFDDRYYGVGAQLMETGHYDMREVEMLKAILDCRRDHYKDGVVAIDGGANIGVHTVEFAKHMIGWGAVLSFEAQERIFYCLAGNIALQNCGNARAIWGALDAQDGGELAVPVPDYSAPGSFGSFELRERLGNENIGQPVDYGKPTSWVPRISIDALQMPRVDLIKLDIEGMELDALAGAVETIKRCRPVLFIETIKIDFERLKLLLADLDYRHYPHGMNVLALHKDDPTAQNVSAVPMRTAA
jgi:FkbM family methyltransferase